MKTNLLIINKLFSCLLSLYLKAGLLILIALMPLHVLLVTKIGIPGIWKECVIASILLAWIVKALLQKKIVLVKTKISIPIVFFIMYCSALLVNDIDGFNANIFGLRNLVQYIIIFFLVTIIVKKNDIKKYIFLVLFVGLWISCVNTISFLLEPGRIALILYKPYHSSTKFLAYDFLGANNYPFYLNALICISLGIFLVHSSKKIKFLLLCNIFILLISSFLTYSRGSLFSLIAVVLFCGLKYRKRIFVYFILLCLIGIFLLPHTMYERFLTIGSYKEAISTRAAVISENLTLFQANPFFGIGLGKVGSVGGENTIMPHNYYMYLLLQTGILGLVIYLWIFVIFFKTSFNLALRLEDRYFKGLMVGVTLYYIMIGVASLTMATGEAFLSAFLFWFLGGVVMVLDNDIRKGKFRGRVRIC